VYDIDLSGEDNKEYTFIQTGYSLPYDSTHSFSLTIQKGKEGKKETKNVQKTANGKICLDSKGVYSLIPESCYKFDQDKITFDTSSPNKVSFKPTHIKIEGKVQLKDEKVASSVSLIVLDASNESKLTELKLQKSTGNSYTFEHYSPINKDIIIEPRI